MSRQPFTRFFQGDFLARVQASGLEGDEIGLYSIAWALMAERRGPISDDMAWLGRRAGISTRRANQIRAKLLDLGLWIMRGDQLGDTTVLGEISYQNRRSEINRSNALERWERGGQPELDFEADPPKQKKPRSSARKPQKTAIPADANASEPEPGESEMRTGDLNGEKTRENGAKTELKDDLIPQETAEIRQSTPQFRTKDSRARATPEPESRYQTIESESPDSRAIDRAEPPPLARVLDAAGLSPSSAEQHDDAQRWVERWAKAGYDLDRTILPTIRSIVASSDDPTSSLKRFDRLIRHAHAKGSAPPLPPAPPSASLPTPQDDPDPRLAQIRDRLRRECGGRTYDGWLRPIRFHLDDEGGLLCDLPSNFMRDWVHTHFADRIGSLARSLGIQSITIGVQSAQAPP